MGVGVGGLVLVAVALPLLLAVVTPLVVALTVGVFLPFRDLLPAVVLFVGVCTVGHVLL